MFYIPSTIVHLSCMFYLFKTFTCLRKSHEDTLPSLPWKHTVVKIKGAHRLYLSDCTEKWLAGEKEEGVHSPVIGSFSPYLYSESLNFLAASGCPDWPFSLIPFFSSLFYSVFWDGLPTPLFSCHCLSHRLWSECTVSLSAWGAVRAMNGLWEPVWLNSDQLSEKSGC